MLQLIQATRLAYLIQDEPKTAATSSSDKSSGKASDKGRDGDDREEKDVLLRSWISVIVGCTIEKEMWETLEET